MLRRRAVLAAAAVPIALLGCGRSQVDAGETRTDEIPVKLTIKLRGDRDVTVENHVAKSRFILIRRTKAEEKELNIMGVEPVEPIKVGGIALVAGVAVHPFLGDGTYTIPPGSPHDPPPQGDAALRASKSSVRVEWWPDGDTTGQNTEEFLRREKECKVKVEDDGTKGRVSCPSILGENVRFSLEMSWDVV